MEREVSIRIIDDEIEAIQRALAFLIPALNEIGVTVVEELIPIRSRFAYHNTRVGDVLATDLTVTFRRENE
jgi:hypothetical protein